MAKTIYADIQKWFKSHIKEPTFAKQQQKLYTEFGELYEAQEKVENLPDSSDEETTIKAYYDLGLELADVCIAAVNLASLPEMQEIIKIKLKLMENRKYDKNGQHIEEN